jgi:uncharacterized membrane protein YhfC
MNILYVTYAINGLLMIAMPIGLAIYLIRKFDFEWRLWWIGAAIFVLSQIMHIPFNSVIMPIIYRTPIADWPAMLQIVFNAAFLGLSAGVFEELFRYGMYRWWAKDARSWGKGLLVGAGHGGIEAILLGALALYSYFQLMYLRNADLAQYVAADQIGTLQAQLTAAWSVPWYTSLLGALERFFTIPVHLALSVLVLQAFTRKQFRWVWIAIGFHALLDGVSTYAMQTGSSALAIEGIAGVFAILSLVIVFALRQPEPVGPEDTTQTPAPVYEPKTVEETIQNLGKTKYE